MDIFVQFESIVFAMKTKIYYNKEDGSYFSYQPKRKLPLLILSKGAVRASADFGGYTYFKQLLKTSFEVKDPTEMAKMLLRGDCDCLL
jgi:hypothetical protein